MQTAGSGRIPAYFEVRGPAAVLSLRQKTEACNMLTHGLLAGPAELELFLEVWAQVGRFTPALLTLKLFAPPVITSINTAASQRSARH